MSHIKQGIQAGVEKMSFWKVLVFGSGNFASQLSWTMVSTYLAIFYTDAVGLSATAVATLFLITRVWDALDDPVTGIIVERTRSKWGRFRPYLLFGPPLLALVTILTFRNPGLGNSGNLVYAYLTYIPLGIIYSFVNIPYNALPMGITKNRDDVPRLGTANVIGMNLGMIILNLLTLKLVNYFGNGNMSKGYQITAIVYAVIALFIFWMVFAGTKEVIAVTKKKDAIPVKDSIKHVFTSRNIMCHIGYNTISMFGIMGRIGVAVYYYLYVMKRPELVGIFMSLPTIVGIVAAPVGAMLSKKFGRKKVIMSGVCLHILGLILMFVGDPTNIPYMVFCHLVYGSGYIASGLSSSLLRDAVDHLELKKGVRVDGTASGFNGLATKTGSAIGASVGLFVLGMVGYVGGQEVTPFIASGINKAVNLTPIICLALSLIPLFFYNISEEEAKEVQIGLEKKRDQANTELQGEVAVAME